MKFFTRHLYENNQNYSDHLMDSMLYSLQASIAGVCFFIHAIFPFIFTTMGSDMIAEIDYYIKRKKLKMMDEIVIRKNLEYRFPQH